MGRAHKCNGPECPCVKCSSCNRRYAQKNARRKHELYKCSQLKQQALSAEAEHLLTLKGGGATCDVEMVKVETAQEPNTPERVVVAFATNNPHVLQCSACGKYMRGMTKHITSKHKAKMVLVHREIPDGSVCVWKNDRAEREENIPLKMTIKEEPTAVQEETRVPEYIMEEEDPLCVDFL